MVTFSLRAFFNLYSVIIPCCSLGPWIQPIGLIEQKRLELIAACGYINVIANLSSESIPNAATSKAFLSLGEQQITTPRHKTGEFVGLQDL